MAKYSLINLTNTKEINSSDNNTTTITPAMTEIDKIVERRPPPVPLRTFQGKISIPLRSPNNVEEKKERPVPKEINLDRSPLPKEDTCSIDSDDLVIFDKKMQSLGSNRSSDSNRSQTTINTDTGYVSSFENERIPTSGKRQFRARFASEDTQSSLDSYVLQRADTIDSLQTNFTDSPFSLKKTNVFNFDRINYKMPSNGSIDSTSQYKPAVPARKNLNLPPTPPRGILDSGKLLQNGQILGSFNSSSPNNDVQNVSSTINSNALNNNVAYTKSKKSHASKISQRQDSNLSSDSYSVVSSPGFNSKNMEVPLLQGTAKFKKSKGNHYQNSNDNENPTNLKKHSQKVQRKINPRQDSNISSDSFSQTSSPSYNSKIMDAPLIVHPVKMHKNSEI